MNSMNYRRELYSKYVSSHTVHLYGQDSLEVIKAQFPVWKRYYGRFLPDDKTVRILDIGCGNGGFVYFLSKLGYKNTSGVDISPEQIDIAKKLGIENVECSDIISFLKEKHDAYDVIFARDVIEHFTKDEIYELLKLIYKSLKQKGILVIQTPNGEGPLGARYRYWDFTHEIAFTRGSMGQILRIVGFGSINFYSAGPVPKGFLSLIRFILWKIIELFLKFYLLVETGTGEGIFTQNIIVCARK